ncbi:MAG TPA: peptidoglycan-binding domain-containing protein, partial [Parvibaculum sp.]
IGGGGRAIRRVSTAWMALLPMAGRAAGSVANAVAVAALRQTRRIAAASSGAWHVLRAGAMSSAAYTAIFARIAFAASARFFSRADMRPVFMRAAALATVAAIVGGIAMTTGPMPGIGIMNVAMRSTAAKPRPVETAMAVPMAEVAAASVPAVEAMPVQVVAGVPLPMPRIAHRPAHHAGRAFASRSAVPERTYADAPARRPMAGSWQPMGGELARSRAFNAPDRIYEAQVRLARLGYPAGPATGLADGQTRYAVALFQRDMRLPMTGDIDGRVLRRLRIADERNSRLADR